MNIKYSKILWHQVLTGVKVKVQGAWNIMPEPSQQVIQIHWILIGQCPLMKILFIYCISLSYGCWALNKKTDIRNIHVHKNSLYWVFLFKMWR